VLVDLMLPSCTIRTRATAARRSGSTARDVAIEPFRVLPGDDTSCLNLYEPTSRASSASSRAFIERGRFSFQARSPRPTRRAQSLAAARREPRGRRDPGRGRRELDDLRPAQDARRRDRARARRSHAALKLVAALPTASSRGAADVGRELHRLFPEQQGYRFLLIDGRGAAADVSAAIERGAATLGADAVRPRSGSRSSTPSRTPTSRRSRRSAGSGCWSATVGLAAVLLRNVARAAAESSALLRAVG
jgi:hypothetical protein